MASKYWSRAFWIDAGDRAIATFAQTTGATLTAGATGILDVDWAEALSVGGLAAAVSVLTSIALRGGSDESGTPDRDAILAELATLTESEREADIQAALARVSE